MENPNDVIESKLARLGNIEQLIDYKNLKTNYRKRSPCTSTSDPDRK
jgi:hypothetical protein